MSKARWADVAKGDRVELNGKPWLVLEAKRKGDAVKVTVKSGSHEATSKVPAKGKVKLAEPLHEPEGLKAQRRWATERELEKSQPKPRGLPPGDATVTKPPAKPKGDDWAEPAGKTERKLESILGARLVGEATDEGKGYYVPPVDVTTIASHLALFHPNTYDAAKDEATMLAGHAHEHKMALEGTLKLGVNHWHTETRP